MRKFFIYSTPRSGSAWLANFLTYGGSFCQHEPLADGVLEWPFYPVCGAVDTGAAYVGFEPPEDVEIFWLYRDPSEVRYSLRRAGLSAYDMSEYKRGFEYKYLFELNYLEEVWDQVTRLPFDRLRAEILIEMNIQRDLASLDRRIRRSQCRG